MANFEIAYPITRKEEGGYAHVPGDRGGETYAGVTRKFFPQWKGWPIIDREKLLKGGKLQWNYKLQDYNLEIYLKQFYLDYWNKARAGEIRDQAVANIYFDHAFNAGQGGGAKVLQEALVELGQKIKIDGGIGPITIAAANSVDPAELHNKIKELREEYYRSIADHNPFFINGWLARLNQFPDQLKKKAA